MWSEVRNVISNCSDLLRNVCNNSAKNEKVLCEMEQRESPQSDRSPHVPVCAEFYPMSPRFCVIDDMLSLSGLRHPMVSNSASAF